MGNSIEIRRGAMFRGRESQRRYLEGPKGHSLPTKHTHLIMAHLVMHQVGWATGRSIRRSVRPATGRRQLDPPDHQSPEPPNPPASTKIARPRDLMSPRPRASCLQAWRSQGLKDLQVSRVNRIAADRLTNRSANNSTGRPTILREDNTSNDKAVMI